MTKYVKNKASKRTFNNTLSWVKILLLIVVLALALIAILEISGKTNLFSKPAQSGIIQIINDDKESKPPEDSTADNEDTPPTENPEQNTPKTTPPSSGGPAAPGATLTEPYGSFVSNHKPNLSGSPAPSQELSTCSTTPGAKCYIQFTKDGVVKTLPAQTVGSDGSTSWTWDVKEAGLTVGNWEITAIATLSDQTKSTKDDLSLEVRP